MTCARCLDEIQKARLNNLPMQHHIPCLVGLYRASFRRDVDNPVLTFPSDILLP